MTGGRKAGRVGGRAEEVRLGPRGLVLRDTGLHLDARRRAPLSFVSHAHSDHVARHERLLATTETLRLVARRLGRLGETRALPYRSPAEVEGVTVELFSAGHILGSAQLRATLRDGRRVTYTGDLNVRPSSTAAPVDVAECDVLVVEATFGHPRYRFPPKEEVVGAVREFCDRALAGGCTPFLFGYALGKAQEAMKLLGDAGYRLCAHGSVFDVCEVYTACGVTFANARRFDGAVAPGEVAVFPPNLARSAAVLRTSPRRTAVLTGWAVDKGTRYRYGTDEAFPLSDHADFDGLLQYVRATGARRVLTVHGFDSELACALRDRGVDAWPLKPAVQGELF